LVQNLGQQFEHAALLYASGACWSISQAQQGQTPNRVAFQRDPEHAKQLMPRTLEIIGLDRYSERAKVSAACAELTSRLYSASYGEDLASLAYLADHEASQMHDAWDHAEGIGPAAYAYGLLAERALRFVLLPVRHGTQSAPVSKKPDDPALVDAE
jgi:LPS sulfotransferase NodH